MLESGYGTFVVEDRNGRQVAEGSFNAAKGLFVPQPTEMQPKGFRQLVWPWRVVASAKGGA